MKILYILKQKGELQKNMTTLRNDMKADIQNIMKDRDEIRKRINGKREKERLLIDICRQDKPAYEVCLYYIIIIELYIIRM